MNKDHKFTDLEYFLSYDHIIYLVRGYYHPDDAVLAYPVFWPDKNGERIHPKLGCFKKDVSDFNEKVFIIHPEYRHNFVPQNIPLVPKKHIKQIFLPKEKIKEFSKEARGTVWYDIFSYLTTNIGIPASAIGIFGSYLVDMHRDQKGKQIKDIDFAIYGLENLLKIKNGGLEKLLRHFDFKHISDEHILYHSKKYGGLFDPKTNSLNKTLANKWSSIQIKPGLLNTFRFVYKKEEVPPNPLITHSIGPIQIKGVVIDDLGSNFMPRTFILKTKEKIYRIVTYFWAFQACVKNGDKCLITGNLHQDGKTISVDTSAHGIKIL